MTIEFDAPGTESQTLAEGHNDAAFEVLKTLAAQLSKGDLELPSLPDVVPRICAAIDRDDCDARELAELFASEPNLAGTILKAGNSVTYRRRGVETTSLITAIARLGDEFVRSLSFNFALQQLRKSKDFRFIQQVLDPEWERGRSVAGLCHALARRTKRAHPDEVLTVGLVHNIGRIYLLTQDESLRHLDDSGQGLIDEWHPVIGSAIAEYWTLPEHAVQAIAQQSTPDTQQDYTHDVSDILAVAVAIAVAEEQAGPDSFDPTTVATMEPAQRLGADADLIASVQRESRQLGELLGDVSDG